LVWQMFDVTRQHRLEHLQFFAAGSTAWIRPLYDKVATHATREHIVYLCTACLKFGPVLAQIAPALSVLGRVPLVASLEVCHLLHRDTESFVHCCRMHISHTTVELARPIENRDKAYKYIENVHGVVHVGPHCIQEATRVLGEYCTCAHIRMVPACNAFSITGEAAAACARAFCKSCSRYTQRWPHRRLAFCGSPAGRAPRRFLRQRWECTSVTLMRFVVSLRECHLGSSPVGCSVT